MYPLKFEPILKTKIWGGNKIIPFKHLSCNLAEVGESWELSGLEGNESVVANGPEKGCTIVDMIRHYRSELLGEENYANFGENFPLLIKFIDAQQDLSVQVHPDDDMAKLRHDSLGKTEMWYVIDADKNAKITSGFSQSITKKEYKERVLNNTFSDVLQSYNTRPGDVFFLPAGRVHAIGAGVFLAEIQESSDITYRIYDYNRKDANGKTRELHIDQARDAINYEVLDDYRTDYEPLKDEPVELVACPYFTTSLYDLTEEISCDYSELDSFVIFICFEGNCMITDNEGNSLPINAGETVLLPACTDNVKLVPVTDTAKLLEVYI